MPTESGKALMKGRKRVSGSSESCQVIKAQKKISSAMPAATQITPATMKPRQS